MERSAETVRWKTSSRARRPHALRFDIALRAAPHLTLRVARRRFASAEPFATRASAKHSVLYRVSSLSRVSLTDLFMTRGAIQRAITFAVASALIATTGLGQSASGISGRVVDERGTPIVGARVELKSGSRRMVSDEQGQFEFRNVALGQYIVAVQRIGYRPLSVDVEVTASGAKQTIVLIAIPQILDSVRVREQQEPNRFSSIVLDNLGLPIPDVAVTVEGVSNTLRTDSLGRFVVPKEVHGTLVVRMRKMGYSAYLGSIRMIATREDTLVMSRLAQSLSAVKITEASGFGRDTFVYKDLDQRMRWRDHQSGVVSREELSAMGRLNLCAALPFTPTGSRYNMGRACGSSCVILNGERKTVMPARAFYADEVEMVEYYPPKSDWSGNLASRGCVGSTLVIWLRKDAPLKPT